MSSPTETWLDGAGTGGPDLAYADVPLAADDAVADPFYLQLRGSTGLGEVYLPAAMGGAATRPRWLRLSAVGLVVVFLLATAAGVCLTYGPPTSWP